jgi:hypothetical protein
MLRENRRWIETFRGLAGGNAVVGSHEGEGDVIGHFRHGSFLAGIGMKSPVHIGLTRPPSARLPWF